MTYENAEAVSGKPDRQLSNLPSIVRQLQVRVPTDFQSLSHWGDVSVSSDNVELGSRHQVYPNDWQGSEGRDSSGNSLSSARRSSDDQEPLRQQFASLDEHLLQIQMDLSQLDQNFMGWIMQQEGGATQGGGSVRDAGGACPGDGGSTPAPSANPGDSGAPNPAPAAGGDGGTPSSAADALAGAEIPSVPSDALNVVTQFGAKGDGSTDDTKAIQNALNACPPGGTVYIPAGTYNIESNQSEQGLQVPSGVTIIMAPDTILKDASNGVIGTHMIGINGSNVNIYGGTIEGNRSTISPSALVANDTGPGSGGGIEINQNASNINIVGVTAEDNTGDGFIAYGGQGPTYAPIKNINFSHDVALNNVRDGITIDNATNTVTDDCALIGNGLANNEPDFYAANGYRVEPDPNNVASNNVIENSLVENNLGQGIFITGDFSSGIWPGNTTVARDNSALDNTVSGNTQGGIWVSQNGDVDLSGNQITTNDASDGIEIQAGTLSGNDNTINGDPYD